MRLARQRPWLTEAGARVRGKLNCARRHAIVRSDHLAVDRGSCVGQKEGDDLSDLLRRADTVHRGKQVRGLTVSRAVATGARAAGDDLRVYDTGRYGVAPDT